MSISFALRLTAALAVSLSLSTSSAAQERVDVTGVVVDSTDVGVPGATVVLLQPSDSVMVAFAAARVDGAFRVPRVVPGAYVLQITSVGYATVRRPVTVASGGLDVGRVRLDTEVGGLDELVVRADRVPVVVRRDTLDYDAAAFRVPPGSTVEDLLRRLPGVEVERDGTVRAQGERVNRVLVDGKEFFGTDPTVATRNLPADAVDRVQVFDKQSDAAEFTGVDDGRASRTINLALREDSKAGAFGSVGGASGAASPGVRYDGTASVHRFTPRTRVSVIANANNVNRQGFGVGDYLSYMGGTRALAAGGGTIRVGGPGISLGDDLSDGFTTTGAGGVNLSHELRPGTEVQGSYFATRLVTERDRQVQEELLFGGGQSSRVERDEDRTGRSMDHRFDATASHELGEGHDVRVRAGATVTGRGLESLGRRETVGGAGVPGTETTTGYDSDSQDLGGEASVIYRRRFERWSVVAEAGVEAGGSDGQADLVSSTQALGGGNVGPVDQRQTWDGTTVTTAQKVLVTRPLSGGQAVQVGVERRRTGGDQDRAVLDRVGGALVPNDGLSSAFERSYRTWRGGATVRRNREALQASVGVHVQHARLDGETVGLGSPVGLSAVHVLPSVTARYEFARSRYAEVSYEASTRAPSVRDLQPVVSNQDPLDVFVGNPDLRPDYTHAVDGRYVSFDAFTSTSLFAYGRAAYTAGAISTARTIDDGLRQTTTPVNLGGAWSASGGVQLGTPVRALRSTAKASARASYDRGLGLVNGAESRSALWRGTVDVGLENRDTNVWEVRGGVRLALDRATYSLDPGLDRALVTPGAYGEVGVSPGGGWRLGTTLDAEAYGRNLFGERRAVPLWGATASRAMMGGQTRIELAASDLLDWNVGVTYANTAGAVQESRVRSLGRRVLLRFTYNLSRIGGSREVGGRL